jgi:ankyrin repeat protein
MMRRYRWRFILAFVGCIVASLAWQIHMQICQSRLNQALYQAVEREDAAAAEHWLSEGANANAKPSDLRVMLNSAPRPMLTNPAKWPILAAAARGGLYDGIPVVFFVKDAATARVVLAHGANPNRSASYGLTVLQQVVVHARNRIDRGPHHYAQVVQSLLTAGADVNAPAPGLYGRTALFMATRYHETEIIRLLRQAGAKG